ncbi:MAG: hypothetical protein KFH87_10270 [Bacteroidetes bacterium]|nr:hypothetical protein [Bacteroidota bacterium]
MRQEATGMWTTPCPSCGVSTFVLHIRCRHCGASVRDRIPVLHLFSTLWGAVEAPMQTALRVGRSEKKNYTYLLYALTGPLLLALLFFIARVGYSDVQFAYLLLALAFAGPVLGLVLLSLAALFQRVLFNTVFGIHLTYRLSAAWLAWSVSPLMWISVFILPLQLAIFGSMLFSDNPAPWEIMPFPFWAFAVPALLAFLWSVLLLPLAFRPYGPAYSAILLLQLPIWLLLFAALAGGAFLLRAILF